MNNAPEVILGVTGSIGAYKAGDLVRHLKDAGYAVTCVMTEEATHFVSPLTLQALSERKVHTDLFSLETAEITHTTLAAYAKLVLIAPATANIIGKYANGVASDLLSCILLGTRAKVLFAPAMNVHMWQHPTVQRNITTLKRLGTRFIGPDVGKLACGYEAIGHLAETDEIVASARQLVPVIGASSTAAPAARKAKPSTRRAAKKVRRKTKAKRRRR